MADGADRRRVCQFCSKVCSSSSALLYHTRLHTGERPYQCKFCQKGFIQKVHLQRHIENNHLPRPPPSQMDSQAPTMVVGNRLEAVAAQLRSRASPLPVGPPRPPTIRPSPSQCPECSEKFMSQAALFEHLDEAHQLMAAAPDQELADCQQADTSAAQVQPAGDTGAIDVDGLTTKAGSRAEPAQCPHCERRFMGQIALLEHIYETHQDGATADLVISSLKASKRSHSVSDTSSKPVATMAETSQKKTTWCDLCQKHLSSPTALMVHLRTHSGAKPYTCEVCSKTFMHQNSLKVHMLTHTGTRPHSCSICSKCFTTTRTLKIHMMIHTGERPYGCKFCGRRFIQQIHLLRHIKSHIRKGGAESAPTSEPLATALSDDGAATPLIDSSPEHTSSERNGSVDAAASAQQSDGAATTNDERTMEEDGDSQLSSLASLAQANQADCLKCQLVEGELRLLRTELAQLKQFLGTKLGLMERKVVDMRGYLTDCDPQ